MSFPPSPPDRDLTLLISVRFIFPFELALPGLPNLFRDGMSTKAGLDMLPRLPPDLDPGRASPAERTDLKDLAEPLRFILPVLIFVIVTNSPIPFL